MKTSLLVASLVPCAHASMIAFCSVVTLGSLAARASDVSTPKNGSALYAALGARAGVEVALVPVLALYANVELDVPLRPYRAALDGSVVYTLPPLNSALGLGVRSFW